MDPVQAAAIIGAGLASLLAGLGIGIKRGRRDAIAEVEPVEHAQRRHCAELFTDHGIRISMLEASYKQFEAETIARGLSLENQIRAMTEVVSGLRADIAALRGEMGFDRRASSRER